MPVFSEDEEAMAMEPVADAEKVEAAAAAGGKYESNADRADEEYTARHSSRSSACRRKSGER
jgi:hypothetical protein